jgi:hypothetical protein
VRPLITFGSLLGTPGLLSLYDVVADSLVFKEEPRLVQQKPTTTDVVGRVSRLK